MPIRFLFHHVHAYKVLFERFSSPTNEKNQKNKALAKQTLYSGLYNKNFIT